MALDDSKRKIVAGILRPGATELELCEIPNEPRLVRRLIERIKREGSVNVCYEAGVSGYACTPDSHLAEVVHRFAVAVEDEW